LASAGKFHRVGQACIGGRARRNSLEAADVLQSPLTGGRTRIAMALERKLKSALNDNRLLILGAQVLFGFQFNGTFQDLFAGLPPLSRALACSGMMLLMLTIGLLITPSMHHRIVEGGEDSPRVLTLTTLFGGSALLPLAIAMGLDIFVTLGRVEAQPMAH
jgi:hypothetical protein